MASGIINMYDINKEFEGKLEWATYTNNASNSSTIVVTASVVKRGVPSEAGIWYWDLEIVSEDFGEMLARDRMTEKYAIVGTTDYTEIFTFTETIPHRANGSQKVNISLGMWIEDGESDDYRGVSTSYIAYVDSDGYQQIGPHPNDGYYLVSLDTIIRKATITSAPNIDDKTTSIPIKYTNPMGNYVSSLEVCIANSTGNQIIVPYRAVNKTGSSYTFNLSSTERQALLSYVENGASSTIRYYIKTFVYETYHYDFVAKTYTLTDAMPTISAGAADMNDTTIALTGDSSKFIRYMSNVAVSINAVAKKGATIVRCDCECGPFNAYNTNGIFQVSRVESGTINVSATDSRNNKVSTTITKTLIPYVKVSCNVGVAMELAGSTGATATLYIRGNYFNGSFGKASNSITLEYRRTDDNGNWGSWTSISIPTSAFSNDKYSVEKGITGLDYKKQYKFQCRVSDKLTNVITDEVVSSLQPIFDWSGSDFNFNVPVYFQGGVLNDFIVEQGTEEMGTNGTWYWFKYKSGRAECYGLRNFGNMGISTAHGALYRSAALTQQLPQDVFMSNSVPDYISINVVANGTGWICRDGNGTSPAYYTTGSFYVVSPTSGNQSAVWLGFHVMGRWK